MGRGVYSLMPRFSFVKMDESDVGDGTMYPMEVTMAQLDEIFYRVKDAWFTGGSVETETDYGDGPVAGIGMSMEGGTPPAELISGDGFGTFYARGYCWWGPLRDLGEDSATGDPLLDGEDIHPKYEPFFQGPYNGGLIPTGDEVMPYYWSLDYLADFFPSSIQPTGYICRDTSSNENLMWLQESLEQPSPRINASPVRTAFSQEMACDSSGTGYLINHPAPSQLRLEVYPEVAWTNPSNSNNFFDLTNKFYLKMRFGVLCTGTEETVALDTYPSESYAPYLESFFEATNIIFQLSGSQCSAKVYAYNILANATFSSATDFVLTAKSFWPYAKGSPPTPIYNTITGAKIT